MRKYNLRRNARVAMTLRSGEQVTGMVVRSGLRVVTVLTHYRRPIKIHSIKKIHYYSEV